MLADGSIVPREGLDLGRPFLPVLRPGRPGWARFRRPKSSRAGPNCQDPSDPDSASIRSSDRSAHGVSAGQRLDHGPRHRSATSTRIETRPEPGPAPRPRRRPRNDAARLADQQRPDRRPLALELELLIRGADDPAGVVAFGVAFEGRRRGALGVRQGPRRSLLEPMRPAGAGRVEDEAEARGRPRSPASVPVFGGVRASVEGLAGGREIGFRVGGRIESTRSNRQDAKSELKR